MIGDQISSFVPEPCMGDDDHSELDLFSCLACDAYKIFNLTVKAEATEMYLQQIVYLKYVQSKILGNTDHALIYDLDLYTPNS